MGRVALSLTIVTLVLAGAAHAGQSPPAASASSALPSDFDGAPLPTPPEVISRDGRGRTTVRAVRLEAPLKIDGNLDESVYESVSSMSDFIQQDPVENARATEKTEVWVFYDRDNVYIIGRCWDSHPERMVINEMRRDGSSVPRNENFGFTLDTFYDRRNGVLFELTPLGGRMDAQVTNERTVNLSWNPVWEFATGRFEQGWTVETRIPFKSLRYRPGVAQVWGFNVRRKIQWKNEVSYLTAIPASFGETGHFRAISLAATLVGVEAPAGSKNLEIKPYAISNMTSDTLARPRISNDLDGDIGVDVKYGITQNLTADFTYNSDFAQVEADEQQVNLTRFSLFFPEKREFFLENQGTFDFGGGAGVGARAGSATGGGSADMPTFFYSRRIGLDRAGQEVPIVGGGRLTGRVGKFDVGLMNIQSDDVRTSGVPSTNFSVVRVKRDILRKSSVGLIYTGRSISERGRGENHAYGVDGTFAFFDNLALYTYWAQTNTAGRSDDISYRAQLDYTGDRYGVLLEQLMVGDTFNPEVGFVRRPDMRRNYGQLRFSPRPRNNKYVRKLYWTGSVDYVESGAGRVETRIDTVAFQTDFQNADRFTLNYTHEYEFLPVPLRLTPRVIVPIGSYTFQNVQLGYSYAPTRTVASGAVSVDRGSFFGGDKTTLTITQGRLAFPPYLSIEPSYSVNKVTLPRGAFTTHLIGSRVNITMTPWMFIGALLQYSSTGRSLSSNVRFRWEYQPGSELFVVYNDQRDTLARGFPDLANRAFIVKINRLFRF